MMKMTKIIFGALSMAFSVVIGFQFCAAGMYEIIFSDGGSRAIVAMIEFFVAIVSGMILIATRNGTDGTIITSGIYVVASFIAQLNREDYPDLQVWGFVFSCFAVVLAVFGIVEKSRTGGHKDIPIALTVLGAFTILLAF